MFAGLIKAGSGQVPDGGPLCPRRSGKNDVFRERASVVSLRCRDGKINLEGGGTAPDDLHLRRAVLPKKRASVVNLRCRDGKINLEGGGTAPDDLHLHRAVLPKKRTSVVNRAVLPKKMNVYPVGLRIYGNWTEYV
jgi:hypothetical protein